MSLAARFMELFAGADRSHGTYSEEDPEPGGKRTIKRTAKTVAAPVTIALWDQHLAGTRPLGVVPIMEDGRCWWAALDIDVYTIDHAGLSGELQKAGIPATVCTTKSGGAHIYTFFAEPILATTIVPRMRELAAMLGHGGCEIFPKQTTVDVERGDWASWLNMPYFNSEHSNRLAIKSTGMGMDAEEFVEHAMNSRISLQKFNDLKLQRTVSGFDQGPPCLESLVGTGFPPGTRNNGVLGLATLAKKMSPDNWETMLHGWVRDYGGEPAFPPSELDSVIRSVRKKDYNYRCGDTPLSQRCNVMLCKTRRFGVGTGGGGASIFESMAILSTDPKVYFITMKNGKTVELTDDQVLNPRDFQRAALRQLDEIVGSYTRDTWINWMQSLVAEAKTIDVPEDSGERGKFHEILEDFITNKWRAENREEVLRGKPWLDQDKEEVCFRMQDMEKAMEHAKFVCPERGMGLRAWMTLRLRDMKGYSSQFKVMGKNVRVWWLKASLFNWGDGSAPLRDMEESPI